VKIWFNKNTSFLYQYPAKTAENTTGDLWESDTTPKSVASVENRGLGAWTKRQDDSIISKWTYQKSDM